MLPCNQRWLHTSEPFVDWRQEIAALEVMKIDAAIGQHKCLLTPNRRRFWRLLFVGHDTWLNINVALCPPKPKLLDIVTLMAAGLAWFGT